MTKISNQYSLTNVLFADTTNGRVGVGTTSPSYTFQVSAATGTNVTPQINAVNTTTNGYGILRLTGASRGGIIDFYDNATAQTSISGQGGVLSFYTNGDSSGTPKVTITSAGNVGIGIDSPLNVTTNRTSVTINGTSTSILSFGSGGVGKAYIYNDGTNLETFSAGSLIYNTAGTERMRILSNGNVGIGVSNPTFKLDVNGEIVTRGASTAAYSYEDRNNTSLIYAMYAYAGYTNFYNSGNKAQINMSSGAYTALSDINKKKDFEQSNIGLNEVLQLKPTLYRLKESEELSPKELGFIAQEVKEFIPQAYVENISGDGENAFIGLNQMPLIAALTKAIQEQQTQINELKALINA